MSEEKQQPKDSDLEKAGDALQRSALRAREIARQTGTPLVIYKNGRIVKERVDQNSK
ncbi:MAG: hypothetical protein MUO88_15615 [Desulfobacterales bacterium]|nr:hypothetical protein [Desulfobacterales bacterium]